VDDRLELGRAQGVAGEVVLRRRDSDDHEIEELIVNGTFAMDSVDTASERRLADVAFQADRSVRDVLVGGLGLGYTAAAVLRRNVRRVDVVEIQLPLVVWARAGLTPTLAAVAADPRVRLHIADIADVLLGRAGDPAGPWDAILLDVDNGPDFLIHDQNAGLYTPTLLAAAYRCLQPGGTLAIWCQSLAPELYQLCRSISATAAEHRVHTRRGDREWEYAIYSLTSPCS
jgi:spermidine synthase